MNQEAEMLAQAWSDLAARETFNQGWSDLTELQKAFSSLHFDPKVAQQIWQARLDVENVIHWLIGGYLYEFCFRPGLYDKVQECYQRAIEVNSRHKIYEYVLNERRKNRSAQGCKEIAQLYQHAVGFEKHLEYHCETFSALLMLPTGRAIQKKLEAATVINVFEHVGNNDIYMFIHFFLERTKSHESSLEKNPNYWFLGGHLYSRTQMRSCRDLAIRCYEEGIKLNDTNGTKLMVNLARLYLSNFYGERYVDYTKARVLLSKAVFLNDAEAMHDLAHMHLNGKGGPVNEPEGYRLLDEAARIGDDELKGEIASFYKLQSNYDKAIKIYEQTDEPLLLLERLELHLNKLGKPLSNQEAVKLLTRLSASLPHYFAVTCAKERLPEYYQFRIALAISKPGFFAKDIPTKMKSHLKRLHRNDCKNFLKDMANDTEKPLSIFNQYKCCEYLLQKYPAFSKDAEISVIVSKIKEEKVALEEFLTFAEVMAECIVDEELISSSSENNNNNINGSSDESSEYESSENEDDNEVRLGITK